VGSSSVCLAESGPAEAEVAGKFAESAEFFFFDLCGKEEERRSGRQKKTQYRRKAFVIQ
jgi:hypothetical protein